MASYLESATSTSVEIETRQPSGWLRVGVVAAVSAIAGGVAAAWWYRNTLTKLRQADESTVNPHFGIPGDDPESEA